MPYIAHFHTRNHAHTFASVIEFDSILRMFCANTGEAHLCEKKNASQHIILFKKKLRWFCTRTNARVNVTHASTHTRHTYSINTHIIHTRTHNTHAHTIQTHNTRTHTKTHHSANTRTHTLDRFNSYLGNSKCRCTLWRSLFVLDMKTLRRSLFCLHCPDSSDIWRNWKSKEVPL